MFLLSPGMLRGINPETNPPVETFTGGNHTGKHRVIQFTGSFRIGGDVRTTDDYKPTGPGPTGGQRPFDSMTYARLTGADDHGPTGPGPTGGQRPFDSMTYALLTGGDGESEGSSPQEGSDQSDCECTSCDSIPNVTPLIGGGDANSTGLTGDTMALTDGSTSAPVNGGLSGSMASVAIRLGGNRSANNNRALVPKGNLFHLGGDLSAAAVASPANLRAQHGMGGDLRRDNTGGYIRQWLGDRHLVDVEPIDNTAPVDLTQGYRLRMYTYITFPTQTSGFYNPTPSYEFLRIEITPVSGGMQIKQFTVVSQNAIEDVAWTMTRSGSSPASYIYTSHMKKYSGGSWVDVRKHSCTLSSASPLTYTRTVEDYLSGSWTTAFKMKEEWKDFSVFDGSTRRRITLQERYLDDYSSTLSHSRVWEYYDTDQTDRAHYGRAKSRHDYGFDSGSIQRLVHWEVYDYQTSGAYDSITIYRSLHGSAEPANSDDEMIYILYAAFTPITGTTLHDYPERPMTAYVYHAGKVASCYYTYFTSNTSTSLKITEVRYLGPSTELVATREYFSTQEEGTTPESKFRPKRFVFPDNTVKTWSYGRVDPNDSHGPVFSIEKHRYISGGSDSSPYRQIDRVWNRQGFLIEESVSNPALSSPLTSFEIAATGGSDIHGRPLIYQYNGNSIDFEQYTWSCCGLESHRERNGLVTQYVANKLKRLISKTEAGGTDAQLEHTTSYLSRDDGGMIVERKTNNLLDSRTHYDVAGRVVRVDRLDPDGTGEVSTNITHSATSTGLRLTATENPDGSTSVRTHYGDLSAESISGTGVADVKFGYTRTVSTENSSWLATNEITTTRLTSTGGTGEYSVEYRDLLGRVTKSEQAKHGSGVATTTYGYTGSQLVSLIDPDGVRTLYTYNNRGERELTVIDSNQDGDIDNTTDPVTADRIEMDTVDIVDASSIGLGIATLGQHSVYLPGSTSAALVSARYTAGSGLKTRSENYSTGAGTPQITTWVKEISGTGIDLAGGVWRETTTRPDSSQTVITYDLWRPATEEEKDSGGNVIASTWRTWGTTERKLLASVTDGRTGETTFAYTSSGHQNTSTLTRGTDTDLVTSTSYDAMGRVVSTTLPNNSVIHKKYTAAGLLWKEWGSQSYPVRYTYDEQGRMTKLETFHGITDNSEPPDTGGSGVTAPDTTQWAYEPETGRLETKTYADSTHVDYTYTDGGRLSTREWYRTFSSQRLKTTYYYTSAGDLRSVNYADSTPDVLYSYLRTGQVDQVKQGTLSSESEMSAVTATHTYTYTGLRPDSETIAGLYHEEKVLTRNYQSSTNVGNDSVVNRYSGFLVGTSTITDQDYTTTYEYDVAGRIWWVSDADDTFEYEYEPNAPHLIASMTGPWHTASRTYDSYRDILATITNTENVGTPSTISKFTYSVNSIGQRTDIVREGGAFGLGSSPMGTHFDHVTYNDTGEVTATDRYSGDNPAVTTSPITGFDYDWAFDGIGNRKKSSVSSAHVGYVSANTNKYTKTFNDPNDNGAQDTGEADISNPTHDNDGNLTQDPDYDYTWDAENRLTQRTPRTPSSGKLRLTFQYDYRGRRVKIYSESWSGSAWTALYDERILYDGWNPVMHYSWGAGSGLTTWRNRSYMWGLDLSGTLHGAGGVGGLLSVTGWLERGSSEYTSLRYYYTYDGNGNVSEIINYNNSNAYGLSTHYEYDSFGNLTRADDNGGWSIGRTNPFRFATKWHDNAHIYEQSGSLSYTLETTKLYYYGHRFYAPQYARWINRDPIGERGGNNLYAHTSNDMIAATDYLGLDEINNQIDEGGKDCTAEAERNQNANGGLVEYCGLVCESENCGKKTYTRTKLFKGWKKACVVPPTVKEYNCPEGTRPVGRFHNHPNGTTLSQEDKNIADGLRPDGTLPKDGRRPKLRIGATRRTGTGFKDTGTKTNIYDPETGNDKTDIPGNVPRQ